MGGESASITFPAKSKSAIWFLDWTDSHSLTLDGHSFLRPEQTPVLLFYALFLGG